MEEEDEKECENTGLNSSASGDPSSSFQPWQVDVPFIYVIIGVEDKIPSSQMRWFLPFKKIVQTLVKAPKQ